MGRLTLIFSLFLILCVLSNEAVFRKRRHHSALGIQARKLSFKNVMPKGAVIDKAVMKSAQAISAESQKGGKAKEKNVIKIFKNLFHKLCLMVGICKREKPEKPDPETETTTPADVTPATATATAETAGTGTTATETTVTEGTGTTTAASTTTTTSENAGHTDAGSTYTGSSGTGSTYVSSTNSESTDGGSTNTVNTASLSTVTISTTSVNTATISTASVNTPTTSTATGSTTSTESAATTRSAAELAQLDLLRETCLQAHNEKRAIHSAPPLTLADDLNEMAQNWADHLGNTDTFEHSTGNNVGENLAGHSQLTNESGEVITNMWYDEIQQYNFSNPGFTSGTGHFTQVVWVASTELGVGMARSDGLGMYLFVANYRPAGNLLGAFEQNVLPPPS